MDGGSKMRRDDLDLARALAGHAGRIGRIEAQHRDERVPQHERHAHAALQP